jgi:peptidoglycan/xylan/chitin deacetylase (PgdA/CDA1 family)
LEDLESIITFLKAKGYDFISLNQLEERLADSTNRKKFAIFTFDDGYLDNLLYAYPLLKRLRVPFTIYLTSGLPDQTQCLWWFYLEDWVETGKPIDFYFAGHHFNFLCQLNHEKREAMAGLSRFLETSRPEVLTQFIKEILEPRFGDCMEKTQTFSLTWPQIQLLSQDSLVTIASHGTAHNNCKFLTPAELKNSLHQSKARIEDKIGRPVEHFAYPFGHAAAFDENVIGMIMEAGYRTATTTLHGNIRKGHSSDLFRLPRISLNCKTGPWMELICSNFPRKYYI